MEAVDFLTPVDLGDIVTTTGYAFDSEAHSASYCTNGLGGP